MLFAKSIFFQQKATMTFFESGGVKLFYLYVLLNNLDSKGTISGGGRGGGSTPPVDVPMKETYANIVNLATQMTSAL